LVAVSFDSKSLGATPSNPLLVIFGIIILLALVCLLNFALPILIALAFCVPPLAFFTRDKNDSIFKTLANILRAMLIFPPVIAGVLAPARGLCLLINSIWIKFPANIPGLSRIGFYSIFDPAVGLAGTVFGIGGGFISVFILLRQVRQVENLPTSTTRAAALGLSEFKGVARPVMDPALAAEKIEDTAPPGKIWDEVPADRILVEAQKTFPGQQAPSILRVRSRFYLEDASGRILVDPREAEFWHGKSNMFFEPSRKIYLSKRLIPGLAAPALEPSAKVLLPGDPVYLVGQVEVNEQASQQVVDAERLIVRPSSRRVARSRLTAMVLDEPFWKPGKDLHDVFFLSDSDELEASGILYTAARQASIIAILWTAVCLWMTLSSLALRFWF